MSEFITVPEVYITDDWVVSDLETLEDCEDAYIVLISICANIEQRIDELEASRDTTGALGKCKAAMKWKKAALNLVNIKKSALNRTEREAKEESRDGLIMSYISSENPELIRTARIWADGVLARRRVEGL